MAESMDFLADKVEAGEDLRDAVAGMLKEHWPAVFNGNGYDPAWPDDAVKKGIWRIDSGVDAINEFTSDKNIELFGNVGVFT